MAKDEDQPLTYSPIFAFIYVFNLLVGVGALALPHAFHKAGLIMGTFIIIVSAGISYMTATFMIEAMAIANAYMRYKLRRKRSSEKPTLLQGGFDDQSGSDREMEVEDTPLVPLVNDKNNSDKEHEDNESTTKDGSSVILPDDYEIREKFEMGTMANLFYHPVGIVLYYICACFYFYGDLGIYAIAVAKSLVTVACTKLNVSDVDANGPYCDAGKFEADDICFVGLTNAQVYSICLTLFALCLCPWTFFNFTRSKYLQLITTIMRYIAFTMMISIATAKIIKGEVADPLPNVTQVEGFPSLFGASIYAYMCQHSLPGMITPMRKKRGVFVIIGFDFGMALTLYLLLNYTSAFHFTILCDLYTLNFIMPFDSMGSVVDKTLAIVGYIIALIPVFTLGLNFPIISITLRENLKSLAELLIKLIFKKQHKKLFPWHWTVDRLLFPILVLVPSFAIAYGTWKIHLLVSITGSFPGVGVEYVIPVTLAFAGKYIITRKLNIKYENKYKSPFSYIVFLVFILLWTGISVILIITNEIIQLVNRHTH